jgi:plasmid stabilization system protein ParE
MPYQYILLEHAQKDFENSVAWYSERSIQAAEDFIEVVDIALQLIVEYPDRWRNSYKNFHELELKKFPFSIIYTIEENEQLVLITSIFHHKKNPKKKYIKQ